MKISQVIAVAFINDQNRILLFKRSKNKNSYPNKWCLLAGTINDDETPMGCLSREIKEEIGITRYQIIREAGPRLDVQPEGRWQVFPFLCRILDGEIKLDKREHETQKWVAISELKDYDLVPGMVTNLEYLGLI